MYLTRHLITHKLDDRFSVLLNGLSGALDVVENRFIPLIENPSALTSATEIYQPLLERGYIFPSEADERREMDRLFAKYTADRQPMTFVVCPTYACNLRCTYCFEGALPASSHKVLSRPEITSMFTAVQRLAVGDPHIQLFGGEPLLPATYEAVNLVLERSASLGYPVGAVTNGVNIPMFMPLLRKFRDHLDDFQITLDGPAEVHDKRRPRAGGQGTFSEIVSGIELLLNEGIHVRLRVNVDNRNIDSLVDLADFIMMRGWDRVPEFVALLSPVDDHKHSDYPHRVAEHETAVQWFKLRSVHPRLSLFRVDLFRTLDYIISTLQPDTISYPRFQYCESNNLSSYTFGTDGSIYLCAEAIGEAAHAVGTYHPHFYINEEAVGRWNGRSVMTIKKCRDCPVATLCGGGCAISACNINGSIDEPYCNGALDTIHAYLDAIKDRLLSTSTEALR